MTPPLPITCMPLTIEAVSTVPAQHPWAGTATPEALARAGSLADAGNRRVTLRFASPTTFKSKGANVPFPLPGLVFGSLLNRWNAHAALQLHPDARRFAEEMVAASKYQLQSRYVAFADGDRGAATGCTGTCRYSALSRDHFWIGTLRTLALFAFWSGVGARTAMGLGQAALWDETADKPVTL